MLSSGLWQRFPVGAPLRLQRDRFTGRGPCSVSARMKTGRVCHKMHGLIQIQFASNKRWALCN